MYFSIIFVVLIIFLFIRYYLRKDGVNIFYAYLGPYNGKMPFKYFEKNPPLIFNGENEEVINLSEIGKEKKQRFMFFNISSSENSKLSDKEIILVDLFNRYYPSKGDYVILRHRDNYYVREVDIPYTGYEESDDCKFKLVDGEIISFPEIIGNVRYRVLS